MSRRQKLYSGSLFDSLVHFICGQEDDYFTRYKATLICDHREGCSGNVVRDVKDYVEVGIAKRDKAPPFFHPRFQLSLRYRRGGANCPRGQDP